MGERPINPLFNVQENYKKVKIINPYKFGVSNAVDLLTGLVSVWEINETSGSTLYDATSKAYDMTVSSGTINQTGKLDKCIDLNGSSNYAFITNKTEFSNVAQLSISCWFNADTLRTSTIVAKDGSTVAQRSYGLYLPTTDGKVGFFAYGTNDYVDGKGNTVISTGTWNHAVVTYNSGSITIYVNGQLQTITYTRQSATGNIRSTTANLIIGKREYITPIYFDGKVDQTAIWNIILDQDKVNALYNSGNGLAYSSW